MMRAVLFGGALLAVAACGIDGPPSQPGGGIETSGEARIGVVGSL